MIRFFCVQVTRQARLNTLADLQPPLLQQEIGDSLNVLAFIPMVQLEVREHKRMSDFAGLKLDTRICFEYHPTNIITQ